METVRDALQSIAQKARLPSLEFDGAGIAELRVEDALSLYLVRITQHELELSVPLDDGGTARGEDALAAMLARIPALLPSRIALDADGRAVLCRRVDVRLVDHDALEAHVLDVLRQALSAAREDDGAPTSPAGTGPTKLARLDTLDKLTFRP